MNVKQHFRNELSMQGSFIEGVKSFLFEPKRKGLFYYRIAKDSYDSGNKLVAKVLQNKLLTKYGCDVSLTASIGKNVRFRHINGIVIGKGVSIGEGSVIYHQVTFGGKNLGDASNDNYPTIGKYVTIFPGAKIVGNITIGDYAIIGANSVVLDDVETNAIVAGMPAKRIGTNSQEKIKA